MSQANTDALPGRGRLRAKHVLSNPAAQWIISALICLAIFAFFMWYHKVRGKDYSLFTTEKCLGITSAFALGITLALGSLSRFSTRFVRLLSYRRTFGLLAAYLCVPHVLLCVFGLPERFPGSWFGEHMLTTISGVLSLGLILTIAVCSYRPTVKRLGGRRWLAVQRSSYFVLALVIVHLLSLGKFPGWVAWLQTFDKPLPPGAMTTTTFCLIVLILNIVDMALRWRRPPSAYTREQ